MPSKVVNPGMDVHRQSSINTYSAESDADAELDQLIATFPGQTADFLAKLRSGTRDTDTAHLSDDLQNSTITLVSKAQNPAWKQTSRVIVPSSETDAPFYSETTYNDFFGKSSKCTVLTQPAVRFGEMPVFTDSLLYPTQQRRLQSTTHETFIPKPITLTQLAKPMPTTLRVEGERLFETTNRSAFTEKTLKTPIERHHKANDADRLRLENQARYRQPFVGDTQFKADFPPERAWNSVLPTSHCVAQPIVPPPSQIQLSQDDQSHFTTEQRERFPGCDPRTNPIPKSCKKEIPPYTRPEVKFANITVTRSDFQPYAIHEILASKPQLSNKLTEIKESNRPAKLNREEVKQLKTYLKNLQNIKNTTLPKV
ncbi:hypothetical protein EG68_09441 [Paragonimus skrjabini miyazakii]|uniref:Uncharacterized protein n=1 Tax=Paragonimus skrjabini miyazakii TaxID=59628 RepID=A0A8S9YT70_9TREM|nr:hypothetical protein EG68_09441 [Paragonimus skrjabini miyazakii]